MKALPLTLLSGFFAGGGAHWLTFTQGDAAGASGRGTDALFMAKAEPFFLEKFRATAPRDLSRAVAATLPNNLVYR